MLFQPVDESVIVSRIIVYHGYSAGLIHDKDAVILIYDIYLISGIHEGILLRRNGEMLVGNIQGHDVSGPQGSIQRHFFVHFSSPVSMKRAVRVLRAQPVSLALASPGT